MAICCQFGIVPKERRLGRWDLPIENSGYYKCLDRYMGSEVLDAEEVREDGRAP